MGFRLQGTWMLIYIQLKHSGLQCAPYFYQPKPGQEQSKDAVHILCVIWVHLLLTTMAWNRMALTVGRAVACIHRA